MQTLKPGTRCECCDENCTKCLSGGQRLYCEREAVVEVYIKTEAARQPDIFAKMCEACAEYHERAGK